MALTTFGMVAFANNPPVGCHYYGANHGIGLGTQPAVHRQLQASLI